MATLDELQGMMGGMDPLSAPIPGESLTSDPEMPRDYEKPPQFTEVEKAVDDLFMRITEEDTIDQFLDLMRDGMPVENIAQVVLFEGFRQGMYNPDLMLLMIEPTIYILLYLADYANIDDVVLYPQGDVKAIRPIKGEGAEGEGTITVGEEKIARPESVTPSLLEKISGEKETPAGKAGGDTTSLLENLTTKGGKA